MKYGVIIPKIALKRYIILSLRVVCGDKKVVSGILGVDSVCVGRWGEW